MNTNLKSSFSKTLLAIGIASATTISQAGSFGLIEQSASGQGVAYAGAAAVAEDASTIYFNPAGMTRLSGSQIVVAGHVVATEAKFKDTGSTNVLGGPLGGPNSTTDEVGLIPNFYYSSELDNGVFVGVGVNVPFGLATEYDNGWVGRYHALRSEISSININPSIAWKATDKVSVGFGLSIQYLDLELTNSLNTAALCVGFGAGATCGAASVADSGVKLEGDSTEIGWNTGILIELDEKSRIGIAYRSAIKHNVDGKTTYNLDPALQVVADGATAGSGFNILQNGSLQATAELPESFSFSFASDLNNEWTALFDYTWTGWSSLDTITIVPAGGPPGNEPTLELAYQNTSRYSVGVHFKPNAKWIYRAGLAYDESPIRSPEQMSARIPGGDRTWVSLGLGFAPSSAWSFDFGYSHLFLSDPVINSPSDTGDILKGTYEADVNILSAQANFNF